MRTMLPAILLAALLGCSSNEGGPVTSLMSSTVPPIDAAAPAKVETVTFAVGWFWTPDAQFGALPAVVRTRVGYTGGTLKDPTYHNLGDHTESIQVDYDPTKITFDQMLDKIWGVHNPCMTSWSRQYMSAIFTDGEAQKKAVLASKAKLEERLGKPVKTAILPLEKFYLAEDYHQKYDLRSAADMIQEFKAIFRDEKEFLHSTAAARVNGYVAGRGTRDQLQKEIDLLGLSAGGKKRLQAYVTK